MKGILYATGPWVAYSDRLEFWGEPYSHDRAFEIPYKKLFDPRYPWYLKLSNEYWFYSNPVVGRQFEEMCLKLRNLVWEGRIRLRENVLP